jgi:hypothetical protein
MLRAEKQTAITQTTRIPDFRKCRTDSPRETKPGAEFEFDYYHSEEPLGPDFPSAKRR